MTERKAIAELITGSEKAYSLLFYQYTDTVFRFVCSYIHNREVARELTQDVFLKLWTNRSTINPDLSFQSFLLTIARNHLFNYLKRQVKEKNILEAVSYHASEADPHNDYDYRETARLYHSSLEVLPARQKKVFLLNREAGLTYRQIADQLNLSISTVEKEMASALLFLKKNLKDAFTTFIILLLTSR
jgi:RNA polymerase sigma-70 factor (ECF subfamily)